MKKILITVFAYIGGAVVLVALVTMVSFLVRATPGVPDETILEVDFERRVIEHVGDNPLAKISPESETV